MSNTLRGINLNEKEQLQLLDCLLQYYSEIPFKEQPFLNLRYYFDNSMYSYSDGIFLYSMIRHFKPKRIIEVGSGFSSAVMLDTNDRFFDKSIECSFIEPFPDRLNSLLRKEDEVNVIQKRVQDVGVEFFEKLVENDILFIDSTHVSKTGSDVNYIFFEILPRLKKGVKVHFHDIFYPFEYPKNWVIDNKRSWNEDYMLRAFLSFNQNFEILIFNTFLEKFHEEWFNKHMPLCLKNTGGNLWIEAQ